MFIFLGLTVFVWLLWWGAPVLLHQCLVEQQLSCLSVFEEIVFSCLNLEKIVHLLWGGKNCEHCHIITFQVNTTCICFYISIHLKWWRLYIQYLTSFSSVSTFHQLPRQISGSWEAKCPSIHQLPWVLSFAAWYANKRSTWGQCTA